MTITDKQPETPPTLPHEGPLELDLTEMFHRKKRTLMLLAGSAILLGCAPGVGAAADALKEAVGQPHLAAGTLRFGLFLAATYYGWGFLHEVLAAHRVNKDRMDSSQLANYEKEVRAFSERLDTEAKSLEGITEAMRAITANIPSRLDETFALMIAPKDYVGANRAAAFSEQNQSRLHNTDPKVREQAHADMKAIYPAALQEARMSAASGIAGIAASIGGLEARQANLIERLGPLKEAAKDAAERIRLNKNIYVDRWLSFWIWEFGASVAIYLFAALVTFTPIGFALGDATSSWVSSPPGTLPFSSPF